MFSRSSIHFISLATVSSRTYHVVQLEGLSLNKLYQYTGFKSNFFNQHNKMLALQIYIGGRLFSPIMVLQFCVRCMQCYIGNIDPITVQQGKNST